MKVAILCNSFKYDGGMETYTLELVEGLLPYLSSPPLIITKKFDKSSPLLSKVNIIRIGVSFLPRFLKDYYFSWRAKKILKNHRIDVVIGCCRNTVSDIVICGGTHKGFIKTKKRISFYDFFIKKLEETQNKNAKLIVAHSDLMRKELMELYSVPQHKISVLYPPVNLAKFLPASLNEKKQARDKLSFSPDLYYFLFVSSSHRRKGFELLKKFFTTTTLPVRLVVVGRPIEEHLKNISYLGYYPNIEEIYKAADFTILASKYEPFGLAAIESVAAGVPVIISDRLGSNEVISSDWKYVFESENLADLRMKILEAIKDRENNAKRDSKNTFTQNLSANEHFFSLYVLMKKTCIKDH